MMYYLQCRLSTYCQSILERKLIWACKEEAAHRSFKNLDLGLE